MDEIKVTAEFDATDRLGMLLRRLHIEAPSAGNLPQQARAIVEKIDYLGGELKVIEVDGVSKAVQIRSRKPAPEGFTEIILRAGNQLTLEQKGAPLHISRNDYERLIRDLKAIF